MALNDYDTLPCPNCNYPSKPRRQRANGSVQYRCDNSDWCPMTAWVIDRDGDISSETRCGNAA